MKTERIVFAGVLMFFAGRAPAQPAAEAPKKAGATMKNVRVLTDVPVEQWDDTMWFMTLSLGVTCDHCHMGQAYERDDRKAKETARSMIQMTRELNGRNFGSRLRITCYTCHQGSLQPKTASGLWKKEDTGASGKEQPEKQTAPSAAKQPETLPDAEQVLARYRKAVAGDSVKTIHLKGSVDTASRGAVAQVVEWEIELPDRMAQRAIIGGAEILQVIDRDRGWAVAPGRIIDMPPANMENARKQVALLGPLKFHQAEAPLKTTVLENIGGRTFVVLESHSDRHSERLYFDQQTGLLYKRAGETHTPLGDYPYETIYDDYRDIDGVKIPFRTTNRTTNDSTRYIFSEIRFNQPIDPSRFVRPATPGGK
jgi:Photosynthetic reaction centre cytochrome C subunit